MNQTIIHLDDPKREEDRATGPDGPAKEKQVSSSRKRAVWLFGVGATVASLVVAVSLVAARPNSKPGKIPPAATAGIEEQEHGEAIPATATHPHRDATLRMTVKQLLSVEPFFETNLRAQLAGVVSRVPRSIGARVKAGDLLVQLDRPDLEKEVEQHVATLYQAQARVAQMEAHVATARAQVDAAAAAVIQAQATYKSADARRRFRHAELLRIKSLVDSGSVERKVYDEKLDQYEAAIEYENAAKAAIATSKAQKVATEASVIQALADVDEAHAKVQVARAEIDKARAMLGFARISAPFDGVVVRRNVVEGSFVQNASTAQTEAMIAVQRTDIVTVVMRVPDNAAPYVTRNTHAILTFDELPGVTLQGVVTRFSPSIRPKDRTMKIEVDLWNDSRENYKKFLGKCMKTWLTPLAGTGPLGLTPLLAGADQRWSKHTKDRSDPLPVLPTVLGGKSLVRLLPGMSGFMRLSLQEFKGACVVPSGAVFSKGGKPYILEVRNGKSHMVPVRIRLRDGRWTKVAVVLQEADPQKGLPEVLGDLTGNEVVIVSRQVEIGDDADVIVTMIKADKVKPAGH